MDAQSWSMEKTVEEYNQFVDDPNRPKFVLPEQGSYLFRLVDKRPNEMMGPKFNKSADPTKQEAKFILQIVGDEDWEGTEIHQRWTISMNEKANLFKVVKALIGRDLEPIEKVGWKDDPANNIVGIGGKVMRASLMHTTAEDGKHWPKLDGFVQAKSSEVKKYQLDPDDVDAERKKVEPEEPEKVPF